jgi:hypothetical protein
VQDTGRVTVLDIACPWHPTTDARVRHARTELLRALVAGQAATNLRRTS